MTKLFTIHPDNPQPRFIEQVVNIIHQGGIIAAPTDSGYALICHLNDKSTQQRIIQIRQLDKHHHFTLMCKDLTELGSYAQVNKSAYRILKANTPGAYTFILLATREVPKRLANPKRKTIGLRIPNYPILQSLLAEIEQPLLSVTFIAPGQTEPMTDAYDIDEQFGHQLDAIIDAGYCPAEPTTIVDLHSPEPTILRVGKGDCASLGY